MKLEAIFVVLWSLAAAGCAARAARVTPAPVTPAPPAPAQAVAEEPISVPQTHVVLPRPQPIQAAALVIAPPQPPPPEPAVQAPKPRSAPKPESRPQATQTQPAGPPLPPSRRIRPVESAAERRRLLTAISSHQRQAQAILAKARTRSLSDAEKGTADRIQNFLEQTETALKEQDLQLAEALSSRALLLCKELNP